MVVRAGERQLTMTWVREASPTTFALTAFDGDTFTFGSIGENATGPAGAHVHGPGSSANAVSLTYYNTGGLGP